MNIEDVKIGMKVKLISTKVTGEYLGYNSTEMLRIGGTGLIDEIFEDGEKHPHVCLDDGYYYDVLDLELCLEVWKVENIDASANLKKVLISSLIKNLILPETVGKVT